MKKNLDLEFESLQDVNKSIGIWLWSRSQQQLGWICLLAAEARLLVDFHDDLISPQKILGGVAKYTQQYVRVCECVMVDKKSQNPYGK